jgi:hypothetical protein
MSADTNKVQYSTILEFQLLVGGINVLINDHSLGNYCAVPYCTVLDAHPEQPVYAVLLCTLLAAQAYQMIPRSTVL